MPRQLTDEERKIRNRERTARLFARYKRTGTDERGNPDAWKASAQVRMGQPTDAEDRAALGLSGAMDASSLKAAYRAAMMRAHPDRGGSDVEAAKIIAAYERLTRVIPPPETSGGVYTTPPPAPSGTRRDTGLRAQLLNPIELGEAQALLADDRWLLQEKIDGKHVVVRVENGRVEVANKQGLETTIPADMEADLISLAGGQRLTVDGELMDGDLHIFDLLEDGTGDLRPSSYRERYAAMERLLPGFSFGRVRLVRAHFGADKQAEFLRLRRDGAEGVVFKKCDAPFSPGRPNSGGDMLKHKFVATLSAIVAEESTGKNSFHSYVFDAAGNRVPLGRCTVPGGRPVPPAETIVEIRYLYGCRGGCLVQPVFLGVRDDVSPGECTESQIQYKGECRV